MKENGPSIMKRGVLRVAVITARFAVAVLGSEEGPETCVLCALTLTHTHA